MISIVPATARDIDFIYACINELEGKVFDKDRFAQLYANVLGSPDRFLFVMENNNENIGYMSIYIQPLLHHNGKVAEVQELIVLPEFRSRGAGRVAIDFAKRFSKEQGCVLIELASNLMREDAHRFYLGNGFKRSHYKFTCDLE